MHLRPKNSDFSAYLQKIICSSDCQRILITNHPNKYYYYYIQKNMTQRLIAKVLKEQQGGSEILEITQMFDQLCSLAHPAKQSLKQFEDYLGNDCGLKSAAVCAIVKKLSQDANFKAELGNKITVLWLKYKIYETLGLKTSDKEKCKTVGNIVEGFKFAGSSLQELLRLCVTAIQGDLEELPLMKEMIVEGGREAEVNHLFEEKVPTVKSQPIEKQKDTQILSYNPDKNLEEQLQDFISDYKFFPNASLEKVLQGEQIIAFLGKFPECKELKILQQISELKDQVVNVLHLQETYLKENGVLNSEMSKIFHKLASDQSSKDIYDNICALKLKILPINVLQLERLISKTNNAKKQIKNKEVLFILGTTGSGKSTNILKLLGYTLKEVTIKGLPTLIPKQELIQQHKSFYTSPQAKSCTRYINAVPIPDKFYKKGTPQSKKILVLCDTPGFGDSAGVQVDIANGVGMINAIHESRSVRVVVLLAYDALVSNRMEGAIKIGEIISSLFHDISKAVDSLAIYFNKVPKSQIEVVPNLVQSKIDNMTEPEKANEKLVAFLQILKQKSEDEMNYIYPLQSDYQALLKKLIAIPAIVDVKQNFRYEFTESTKREINNFVTVEKGKIKDYVNNQRLSEARCHFKMLQKLKNIIYSNDKIQETYTEVAKFIQKESLKEFKNFEEYLIEVCNGEDSDKLSSNIAASKRNIEIYEDSFYDFEEIVVTSKEQINKTVQDYKQRLLGEFKDLNSTNSKNVCSAVKIFSRELAPQLETNVVDVLNSQFNKIHRQVLALIQQKNYFELGEPIKALKTAAGFIHFFSPQHASLRLMEQVKASLAAEVDLFFEFISQNILRESIPLTQRNVKATKDRLSQIELIGGLKIVEESANIAKRLTQCIKSIINKCKSGIRELDTIDLSISSDEKKPMADNNYLKNLAAKKTEIELLMTISNVGEVLKQDYEYTKENIGRRLTENVQILNNCISALKGNKTNEIERDVTLIKKAADIVLKCSQIVDQGENSTRLAESISVQFLNYLSEQMRIVKGIEIRLSQINEQSIRKIDRQYKKNQTYTKMASIGPQIQKAVTQLKEQFSKTLINPFVQFRDREIKFLNEKGHYKYINLSLERFEKLCYYALQIEQIVSLQDYAPVSVVQKQVQGHMLAYFNKMKEEVIQFCQNDTINKNQQYVKDLLKVLIALAAKTSTTLYLSRNMDLQVTTEIERIKQHLINIKSTIETKYSQCSESPNKIEEFTALIKVCRFYSSVEEAFKIRQDTQRINFRQLEKTINISYLENLKSDEDRAKSLIEGSSPTKMIWGEIKAIYDQFSQLKTSEGNKKKSIITHELQTVERNILQGLRLFNTQITNNPDTMIKNREKMNDFLELFKQAFEIQAQLNSLYTQEDKRLIQISNRQLRQIGANLIEIFKSEFDSVKKQLTDFNIVNIKQKINNFGGLETIINNVFLQDEENEHGEHRTNAENVRQYIESKKKKLDEEIQKNDYIEELEKPKNGQNRITTLKLLLTILEKGIRQQIKQKYDNFSDDFVIDSGFKRYYNNFIHPKDGGNIEHKNYLIGNVNLYFTKLFNQYKEKIDISVVDSEKIQKLIITALDNLPADIRQISWESFKKVQAEIKDQNDNMVQDLSEKIIDNANQMDNYLEIAYKALKKGQQSLHLKFIEKLEHIYTQKSRTTPLMPDRVIFINDYFLRIFQRNIHILDNDPKMMRKLKMKFDQQLQRVTKLVQTELNNLKKFMENPVKAKQQGVNALQSVADIFKGHFLIIDLGKDQAELKDKFIKNMQQKLGQVAQFYNQKITSKPQENLSSAEILDNQKVKKIKAFIQYLNATGQIIQKLKEELENISNIEGKEIIGQKIVQVYKKIEKNGESIKIYEDQINNMLEYASQYDFYDDKKKNMTGKQFQANFMTIDRTCEILKQRGEFFKECNLNIKSQYQITIIVQNLQRRFRNLITDSKSEIEDTFKDYNNDPARKVNLLMNVFNIMKQKKSKMIPKEQLDTSYKEMSRLIKSSFERVRQKCYQCLKIASERSAIVNKEIKSCEQKKNQQIEAVKKETQDKITAKSNQISKKFDERIAVQSDANKKKDHENGKKTEINSLKNDYNDQKQRKINDINKRYSKIIGELRKSVEQRILEFAETLILYKKTVLDINYQNEKQVANFQQLLLQIPKSGPRFIKQLEQVLDQNPKDLQSIGRVLLTTNKIFSNFVTRTINKLIRGKDIDYVLQNLQKLTDTGKVQIPNNHKTSVKKQYQMFKAKYEQYKLLYKNNPYGSTIQAIATACRDLGTMFKSDFYQSVTPAKGDKVLLLAGIFALWVIQKAEKLEEDVEYTIEPHPTQITTLILLLGIANDDENISNRLAQVGTGEGKSIILAGLSAYLALCGFKVRCACYSAYLSGRDESNFRQLFERLGIQNEIKYGTFNQLCEDILNQGGSNFKAEVEKMILQKPQSWWQKLASKFGSNLVTINRGANKLKDNPTILVIDEVDVFFEDNFYGNTYCPAIKLRDQTVTRFLEYVWTEIGKNRKNIKPSVLIESKEFKQLVDRYPSLSKLLENQVHGMVAGAMSYKHDYFIIDKKLVYKDNDTFSPNINYGYKTVFANIFEKQRNNVSRSNLDEALQISLMVAQFSYAMLPSYFGSILGVTGTLEVLPQYKKKQLKERYVFEDHYAIPSAFGINKLRTQNYYIVPNDCFHQTIINKIKEIKDDRPIIVFFKGAREINEFSQSPLYEEYLRRTSTLTEEHEPSVRDSRIVRAVNAGNITLMTNSFGRGTDFILLNQAIKEKGGLHIIHAFLSHEQSEEIQIKGRTARQSMPGSYDCILSENVLEELNLKTIDIPKDANSEAIHNILFKAREDRIDKLSQTTLKMLEQADKKHDQVVKIFKSQSLEQRDLIKYISRLNLYPEIRKLNIKTVLGLDGTGSMGGALRKICQVIGTAFERAYIVLNDTKVKASIEIKIMVYRNYDSPFEEILETTAFENTHHNLRKFLERVGPKGGWVNEAIEVFFQALNKEDRIDQVILIGDAAPNTYEEVIFKRSYRGENYWNSNGFPATNYIKELDKFMPKKSPVHSFYLNAGAAFSDISGKTGGTACPFNLNSNKVADELTAFVVQNVLKLIEIKSEDGKLNLVEAYRKMFT